MNIAPKNDWHLFDLLDPIQLGFIYESLCNNAFDSDDPTPYLQWMEQLRLAIDANCGWDSYTESQRAMVIKLADYDNRMTQLKKGPKA